MGTRKGSHHRSWTGKNNPKSPGEQRNSEVRTPSSHWTAIPLRDEERKDLSNYYKPTRITAPPLNIEKEYQRIYGSLQCLEAPKNVNIAKLQTGLEEFSQQDSIYVAEVMRRTFHYANLVHIDIQSSAGVLWAAKFIQGYEKVRIQREGEQSAEEARTSIKRLHLAS